MSLVPPSNDTISTLKRLELEISNSNIIRFAEKCHVFGPEISNKATLLRRVKTTKLENVAKAGIEPRLEESFCTISQPMGRHLIGQTAIC